jgi:hypothetical protein
VTSRVDCSLETVFQSQGRRNVLEGRRKDLERGLQQGTSGRFTTRTEDLCTVQQKAIVHCPLVCSWGKLNNKLLIRLVSSKHSQRHGVPIQIPELGAVRGVNWFRYIIKLHGKHGVGLVESRREKCEPFPPFFPFAVSRAVIELWNIQPLVRILEGFGRRHYVLESACKPEYVLSA